MIQMTQIDAVALICGAFTAHAALRYANPSSAGQRDWSPAPWIPLWLLNAVGIAAGLICIPAIAASHAPLVISAWICMTASIWALSLRCRPRRGRYFTFLTIRENQHRVSLHIQKGRRWPLASSKPASRTALLRSVLGDLEPAIEHAANVPHQVREVVVATPWFAGGRHANLLALLHKNLVAAFPGARIERIEEPITLLQRYLAKVRAWGKQWEARAGAAGQRHIYAVGYRVVLVPTPAFSEKAA